MDDHEPDHRESPSHGPIRTLTCGLAVGGSLLLLALQLMPEDMVEGGALRVWSRTPAYAALVLLPMGLLLGVLVSELSLVFSRGSLPQPGRIVLLALAALAGFVSAGLVAWVGTDALIHPPSPWMHWAAGLCLMWLVVVERWRVMTPKWWTRVVFRLALVVTVGVVFAAWLPGAQPPTSSMKTAANQASKFSEADVMVANIDAPPNPLEPDDTLYAQHIQPLLDQYCIKCHGQTRQKGGLAVDTKAAILAGGINGVVVAEHVADSSLIQRVLLPMEQDEHMPPSGSRQLLPHEVDLLAWWVEFGASFDIKTTDAAMPQALADRLPDRSDEMQRDSVEGGLPGGWPEIQAIAEQVDAVTGLIVTPIAKRSSGLRVRAARPASLVTDADVRKLEPYWQHIVEADLSSTSITDAALLEVARWRNLHTVNVSMTAVSDAGIEALGGLARLTSLNFNQTEVTDKGFESLAAVRSLRRVFAWETAVTPGAVARFEARVFDADQDLAIKEQIRALKRQAAALKLEVIHGAAEREPAGDSSALEE